VRWTCAYILVCAARGNTDHTYSAMKGDHRCSHTSVTRACGRWAESFFSQMHRRVAYLCIIERKKGMYKSPTHTRTLHEQASTIQIQTIHITLLQRPQPS
jgi:hypothetical protein